MACLRRFLAAACVGIGALVAMPAWAVEVPLVTLDWAPYSGDIAQQGFLSVVIRQAYATQGHTLGVKVFPWRRAIKMSMEGSAGGPLGFYSASALECADAKGLPSDPIGAFQFGLAQRKGSQVSWRHWSDLHGKRIGVVDGYDNGPDIARLIEQRQVSADVAPSDLFSLKKLAAKRVDYVSIDLQVFEYLKLTHRLSDLELTSRTTTPRLPLYVCFNRTPLAQSMRVALNEGLKRIDARQLTQNYLRASAR